LCPPPHYKNPYFEINMSEATNTFLRRGGACSEGQH